MLAPVKESLGHDDLLLGLVHSTRKIPAYKKTKNVVADLFDLETLRSLRKQFIERSVGGIGDETLKASDFKVLLGQYVPLEEIENIYTKIDVNNDGVVLWQEFTAFLIAAESSNRLSEGIYSHEFVVRNQQQVSKGFGKTVHKDMIECMCFISKPSPILITGGRDGKILLWNPYDLSNIGRSLYLNLFAVITYY